MRSTLRLSPRDVLIGAVGRLDEQKGHRYLLEALAKLRVSAPVKLVIVGDGPLRRGLEGLARALRLGEDAVFVGEAADVPAWLSALDLFALPSLWEGLPNALLEAMALGLAVVATGVDGVPEAIRDGVDGLLCEPKDSHGLFLRLQELALDAGRRERLGAAAKRVVAERFRLEEMLAGYQRVYAAAAAQPPGE